MCKQAKRIEKFWKKSSLRVSFVSEGNFIIQTSIVATVRDVHFAIDISLDAYSALDSVARYLFGRATSFFQWLKKAPKRDHNICFSMSREHVQGETVNLWCGASTIEILQYVDKFAHASKTNDFDMLTRIQFMVNLTCVGIQRGPHAS